MESGGIFSGMKVKTSVTLSEEILEQLDRALGPGDNRSAVTERALREYLTSRARLKREADDLEILNRESEALNEEALDVLSYQVDV